VALTFGGIARRANVSGTTEMRVRCEFWGGGFAFHVGGALIHLLLLIALILFILNFVRGGRSV
jgi:hypothetical protein